MWPFCGPVLETQVQMGLDFTDVEPDLRESQRPPLGQPVAFQFARKNADDEMAYKGTSTELRADCR